MRFRGENDENIEADYHVTPKGEAYTSRAEFLAAEGPEEPRIIAPERRIFTPQDLELEAVVRVIGPEVSSFPTPVQIEIAKIIKESFPELMMQQQFATLIQGVSAIGTPSTEQYVDDAIKRAREQISGRLFVSSEELGGKISRIGSLASLHKNSLLSTAEPFLDQIQRVPDPNRVAISALPENTQRSILIFVSKIHQILERTIQGLQNSRFKNVDPRRTLSANPSQAISVQAQNASSSPEAHQEFLAKTLHFIDVFVDARATLVGKTLSDLRTINPKTLGHILGILFRAYGYIRSFETILEAHKLQHEATFKSINISHALTGLKRELADLEDQLSSRQLRMRNSGPANPLLTERKETVERHISTAKRIVAKERLGLK